MKAAGAVAKLFATLISLVLLIGWVSLCSYVFWQLLASTPEGVTSSALQALAWPFATILLTVPLLAILLLGGLEMLRQVLALRTFLGELPEQVSVLETLGKRFESSRDLIADAASAIDQSTSQLADVEARVKWLSARQDGVAGAQPGTDLIASLSRHLEKAKELFDAAAADYERDNKQGVTRARGWILAESVSELRTKGYLTKAVADYVDAALEVDRRTRRAGRSNLEQADIERLDRLEPR